MLAWGVGTILLRCQKKDGLNSSEEESNPKSVGDAPQSIFFFESRKKTKRFRRKASRVHSVSSKDGGGDFLDSSEKVRPNKRCRAHESGSGVAQSEFRANDSVSSDPFSLNRVLNQVIKDKTIEVEVQRSSPPSQTSHPTPSGGIPFDLNDKVSSQVSVGAESQNTTENIREEGETSGSISSMDLEVEATVNLGNQLGMELGACRGLVKNIILGKGINDVSL
ncbi:hypothetical protein Hanom_Chr08g00751341 [Helianthus anomalus]